jgi:hypothetical protein
VLNGLCRFGVKNARGVSFSGEKRGVCGENIGGCGEKVENSGKKCNFAGGKKMYHVSSPSKTAQAAAGAGAAGAPADMVVPGTILGTDISKTFISKQMFEVVSHAETLDRTVWDYKSDYDGHEGHPLYHCDLEAYPY